MQETQQAPIFTTLLEVWRRRRWLAMPIFLCVLAAAVSIVVFLPDVYTATATVLVEQQKVPESYVQSTVTSGVDTRLQSITQQILSRSRLESLIERFNLYPDLRQRMPMQEVIRRMRGNIALELKGTSNPRRQDNPTIAFTISYSGSDPYTVAQVTNTLASFYIEENLKVREQQASNTLRFLRIQLAGAKKELETLEQQLSQFKERHIGELPEQLQANLAMLERLNTQLRLNSDKQARLGEQRSVLAQQLAEAERPALASARGNAGQPETHAERLHRLQQELVALRTRFGERYPDVAQTKAEIAALRQHLARLREQGALSRGEAPVDPYVRQLRKELAELAAEMKALQVEERSLLQSIAVHQERVENTPRHEQELQVMLRDYETNKELYRSLLTRQEEARLAESLEQRQQSEQFRLLEPATPPVTPTEPNRRKGLMVGLMLAVGLAAGAVFLAEQLDSSFHTVDDLRTFSQVPVLVNLPRIVTKQDQRLRRVRFGFATAGIVIGLMVIVGSSYVAIKGPDELAAMLAQRQPLVQKLRGVMQ